MAQLGFLGMKRFPYLILMNGYASKASSLVGLHFQFILSSGGLLFSYQLQLHDLTPNGMLHIVCFITLCEGFLGIYPHWGLWKRLFNVKRTNSEYAVGQVGISMKDKSA